MWKTFQYNNESYIVKLIVEENFLQLYLSNLKILWIEEISLKDCLGRFKEINPFLESTEEGIKEQIATMINNISEASITDLKQNDPSVSLIIETPLDAFNIKFKFILLKVPDDTFFSEVTTPLIQTVKYLEESQKMMVELLKKKDRELEEYRLEKGNISREDLVTIPFVSTSAENDVQNSLMLNLYNNITWTKFSDQFDDKEKERITNKVLNNERKVRRKVYSVKTSKKKK